jgi:hypothetical protein
MADAIFSLGYFSGINTVDDSARLSPVPVKVGTGMKAAYPLVEAVNVEIDNTYALESRQGSLIKIAGSGVHSLWGRGDFGFYIDNGILYLLNSDYTTLQLMTGLANTRMSYVQVNDRVYMTNGAYIGYYSELTIHSLVSPVEGFKAVLPAGQRIAYLKGTLYVAKGKVLYIADALCDHYDIRTGFKVFENDITMLRPADNGIYVADGKTWYLSEKRAFADDASEFRKEQVLDIDAIPFTDVLMSAAFVGEGGEGEVAVWLTSEGVCMGDSKGAVKIVTPNYLMKQEGGVGASAIRNIDGQVRYIATVR